MCSPRVRWVGLCVLTNCVMLAVVRGQLNSLHVALHATYNIQHYEYVLFDCSDCFSVHIAQVKIPHRKFLHVH